MIFATVCVSAGEAAIGQVTIDDICALYDARTQQLQNFSVELQIMTQFRESEEGPPPWPLGNRNGSYRFAYSHGEMRLSGRWQDNDDPEQILEASYDGAVSTRVYDGGTAYIADITSEAGRCFPDGKFPLDFLVSLSSHPVSELARLMSVSEESTDGEMLVLESEPRPIAGTSELTKARVELDVNRGYALHRAVGLAKHENGGDWVVNSELKVSSWYDEQEGIWLPKEATFRHYSWANTDLTNGIEKTGLVRGNDLSFTAWKLGDVTLEELVIPDGTVVTDRVNGNQFVMRNITDQDVTDATANVVEPSAPDPPRPAGSPVKTILLIASGAAVLILACLFVYRRPKAA